MDQQEEDAQAEAAAYQVDMARKAAKLEQIAALANSVRDFLDAMQAEEDLAWHVHRTTNGRAEFYGPYGRAWLDRARWTLQLGFMELRRAVTKPTSF